MAAVTAQQLPDPGSISNEKLLAQAQERFRRSLTSDAPWREQAVKELDFCDALEHWDQKARDDRQGRPCLTFDLIGPKVAQVVNDNRQNPPEVKYTPVGSGSDKDEAKMLMGLSRNIDQDSGADTARETAFEYAVKIGRGCWREDFEWETQDPEPTATSFQQKIVVRRIANPFSAYPDPASDEFDYSDMMFCFLTEDLDSETFEELYGEDSRIPKFGGNFEGIGDPIRKEWFPNGSVRVAEYWWIEIDRSYLYLMPDGRVLTLEQLQEGEVPRMRRVVEKRTVNWAKITGMEVLERKKWPGKWIPIIFCVGKEILKGGKRVQTGMIRAMIDANKSYDWMRSKEAEAIGLAPISQWLVAEGSIENHEWKYADSNRKAFAYLEYKTRDAEGNVCEKPQRINTGVDTAGITQAIAHAAQDVMVTSNVYAPDTGQPQSDQSGRAIALRHRESDNAHFNYQDNLARSMRHEGRIRLDLIPYVYSEDRIITITDPDGKVRAARINGKPRAEDGLKQAADKILDLTTAPSRFNVVIGSGPGYATQRAEGFQQMMQMAQADPQILMKAGDIIIRASDAPYADEIADRLMPPGASPDTPEIPPAAQAQIQQFSQLNQQLTKSVNDLVQEKESRKLEIDSRERIAAADRAARIEQTLITSRATLAAARLKLGHDAEVTALDAEMRAIENMQDLVVTESERVHQADMAQADRDHQMEMAAQQPPPSAEGAQPEAEPQPAAGE